MKQQKNETLSNFVAREPGQFQQLLSSMTSLSQILGVDLGESFFCRISNPGTCVNFSVIPFFSIIR
jgi:hypothetical protein